MQWTQALSDADIATIAQGIKDDNYGGGTRIFPGALSRGGQLYVPNRGVLTVLPGDWIATDAATGFVILLSPEAAAGAQWVHS